MVPATSPSGTQTKARNFWLKPLIPSAGLAEAQLFPITITKRRIASILARAGIRINGPRPWDIQVHDERFYRRVLLEGSIGAGEAYMDGWWDVEALDEFFTRARRAEIGASVGKIATRWLALLGRILNRQTEGRALQARQHYDLGNELYEAMLGPTMQYTCAYWAQASTLDQAQQAKLRLVCQKLQLRPGMTVLELGGGFGEFARYAATECGCAVVSYNISSEQLRYARDLCRGLPVRFEENDYREAAKENHRFDRIAAIGLCEHIGHKNYRAFMELAHRLLSDRGLFLLHTIGGNRSNTSTDPWFHKYIFPNAVIPSAIQLAGAMEGLWVVEDWHNFGPDYERTLLAWWRNVERAWPLLQARYGGRFYRMWKYYLMASAGSFRARKLQLWQLVLSKGDIPSYTPVR